MQEELGMLEARYKNLQALVGELLVTNQQLRAEVALLKEKREPIAWETHPQRLQDR